MPSGRGNFASADGNHRSPNPAQSRAVYSSRRAAGLGRREKEWKALQARRRKVPWVAECHRLVFWGRYHGLAQISAHASQWNDGPRAFVEIFANASSDTRITGGNPLPGRNMFLKESMMSLEIADMCNPLEVYRGIPTAVSVGGRNWPTRGHF